jgi:hypothetical protein
VNDKKRGLKKDTGKPKWSMMPFRVLREVVKVFMHGNKKYGRDNWKVAVKEDEFFYWDALISHYDDAHTERFEEKNEGLILDNDSKLPTLAHIIANCLILLWYQLEKESKV